jgi:uncharacterized protein (DUF4415 family)
LAGRFLWKLRLSCGGDSRYARTAFFSEPLGCFVYFYLLMKILKKDHIVRYCREPGTPLTAKEKRELAALAEMPDSEIDTSDIPEWTDEMWKRAVRGRFYKPGKQTLTLLLDSDVIAWLKKDGEDYHDRANAILRESMVAELKKTVRA